MPAPTSRNANAAPALPIQIDQREWHDRQTAELQQGANPQIGYPAPPENRAMHIGFEADQCAKRGRQKRQRYHYRHQPCRHVQLDDHHAVKRADQQGYRYADGDLEQRQAHQARERQFRGGDIRERQEFRADRSPFPGDIHPCTNSSAWL
jgi:hypothetical protein